MQTDGKGDAVHGGEDGKEEGGKSRPVAHLHPDVPQEDVVDDEEDEVAGQNDAQQDKVLEEGGHHAQQVEEENEEEEEDVAKVAPVTGVVDPLLGDVLVPGGGHGANVQLLVVGELKDVAE